MKQTKQQLVELVTDLQSKLSLANEQHDNVVDELNKLRSSCVSKSTYDELFLDHQSKCDDYNQLKYDNAQLLSEHNKLVVEQSKTKTDYDETYSRYKVLESRYDKLNADKSNQIDNLQSQIRKLEHDHAGCITRDQYGKLEVQLASVNDKYEEIRDKYIKLEDESVNIVAYEDAISANKQLALEAKSYAASNADLYQKVADMSKSNKWLKISLVTSVVMLIASLVW